MKYDYRKMKDHIRQYMYDNKISTLVELSKVSAIKYHTLYSMTLGTEPGIIPFGKICKLMGVSMEDYFINE